MGVTDRKLGAELCDIDRLHALAVYRDRYTGQHRPDWAKGSSRRDGSRYKPHFKDDADWLQHTLFKVRRDGRLDLRARSCESFPTWPWGTDDWS